MRNLSIFMAVPPGWYTTVTVSFTDASGGQVRAAYQATPLQVEEGRSDDPDRLRPVKADLDQPRGTGDPRCLEVVVIGLGAVVYPSSTSRTALGWP